MCIRDSSRLPRTWFRTSQEFRTLTSSSPVRLFEEKDTDEVRVFNHRSNGVSPTYLMLHRWAGLGLNAGLLKHHFKGRTQCPIATTPGATQQKTLNAHLVPINAELCHVCGSFAAILVPAIRHMIHGFETTILRPTNVQQLQTRPCFHPSRVAVGIIMKAPGNKGSASSNCRIKK